MRGSWHQGQRSIKKSLPQKGHLLDMTFIPAKYETDGLHCQETIGWKRKRDVWTDRRTWLQGQRSMKGHTPKRHLPDRILMLAKYETDWMHSKGTTA